MEKNNNEIVRMNLKLPKSIYNQMKLLASIEDKKGWEYINILVEKDLNKNKEKMKEYIEEPDNIAIINIEDTLLKKVTKIAKSKGTTKDRVLNDALNKGLERLEKEPLENTKERIKRLSINDKLPKVKTNGKKKSLKEMAGIIDLEYETNSVDLIHSIH